MLLAAGFWNVDRVRGAHQGAVMTTVTAMIVGALLAWTPSLLVFVWIMRDIRNTRGR
jgi:hypothetical protein